MKASDEPSQGDEMFKKHVLSGVEGKAAAILTRGAYASVRNRERREERQDCEPEGGQMA